MQTIDVITLITAIIGAVLGIFNLFWSLFRTWERITVETDRVISTDGPTGLRIKIINKSFVSVTIERVGFLLGGKAKEHVEILTGVPGVGYVPKLMQPRTSFTVPVPEGIYKLERVRDIRGSFAQSACGTKFEEHKFVREDVIPDSDLAVADAGEGVDDI